MLADCRSNNAAGTVRASGLVIKGTSCAGSVLVEQWGEVLWRALDMCRVVDHHQRASPALTTLDIHFNADHSFRSHSVTPIIRPLVAEYAALLQRLEVLRIAMNHHDEAANIAHLESFINLRELAFVDCGLTSVRGLRGCCPDLKKVSFSYCKQLSSLDGLQGHEQLSEVVVSCTPITHVRELLSCCALSKVNVSFCQQLSSLDGLQDHEMLEELIAPCTAITSLGELLSCFALKKVDVGSCCQLASLHGLQGHTRLRVVDACFTPITSASELVECRALSAVDLSNCNKLKSAPILPGVFVIQ